MPENGLRSSELADAAGVNVQTLRYYERRGLLEEPDRTLGGHRLYPAQAITTLRVIKALSASASPSRRSPPSWRSANYGPTAAPTPDCRPGPGSSWPKSTPNSWS